ncbi:MAG: response regulator [Pseudomonadota bacterium]
MSFAESFTPHLPFLRRYARALSGTQEAGDAYVKSTLEAMLADPEMLDADRNPRVELFRVFSKVWSPASADVPDDDVTDQSLKRLELLTPRPRQAFLLLSLEGFTVDEVSVILDTPVSEVENLIDEVGRQIASEVVSRVMIIEDEPLIQLDLKAMMEELGHEVTGVARTHTEAVEKLATANPQILLADIQLADGSSGIDAVNDILKERELPVIFITAYPERLLTGDRPEPTYLISKPFSPEMVKALTSQALFFGEKARSGTVQDAGAA